MKKMLLFPRERYEIVPVFYKINQVLLIYIVDKNELNRLSNLKMKFYRKTKPTTRHRERMQRLNTISSSAKVPLACIKHKWGTLARTMAKPWYLA